MKKAATLIAMVVCCIFSKGNSAEAYSWPTAPNYHEIAWYDIKEKITNGSGGLQAAGPGKGYCLFGLKDFPALRFVFVIDETPLSKALLAKVMAAKTTGEKVQVFIVLQVPNTDIWYIGDIEGQR